MTELLWHFSSAVVRTAFLRAFSYILHVRNSRIPERPLHSFASRSPVALDFGRVAAKSHAARVRTSSKAVFELTTGATCEKP
jgi:hypothetical protein